MNWELHVLQDITQAKGTQSLHVIDILANKTDPFCTLMKKFDYKQNSLLYKSLLDVVLFDGLTRPDDLM